MDPTSLRDARTHNLKGVDLDLAPGELIVVAGVSGSGKSSLALDTLYAEGSAALSRASRRTRGSSSSAATGRRWAGSIPSRGHRGRSRRAVRTSRSTVGTMTELQDYLRLLWTRAAAIECDGCGREVARGTVAGATSEVLAHGGAAGERAW